MSDRLPRNFAEAYFQAVLACGRLESQLTDKLFEMGLADGAWDDWTADYYDESMELHLCPEDLRLTDEQQAKIWALGFKRCWLNHRDGFETSYTAALPGVCYRKNKG